MKKIRYVLSLVMVAILSVGGCLFVSTTTVYAGKTVTVECTSTISGPPVTMLPAGDEESHLVGLGQRTGEVVFKDGRVAKYSNVFFLDLHQGKGSASQGYTKMVFKDGSWMYFKWKAKSAKRDKAGLPLIIGTGEIIRGTGVYEGITGTAKFETQRFPPNEKFPEGYSQAEAILTYTLP